MTTDQFEGFVTRHRAGLVRAGYNAVENFDDAEDITQEVLMAAWRNREGIQGGLPYFLVAIRHRARRPASRHTGSSASFTTSFTEIR